MGFAESYAVSTEVTDSPAGEAEEPEDEYERDVYERSLRVFWWEKDKEKGKEKSGETGVKVGGDGVVERVSLRLEPGEKCVVSVGVYGKKGR